MTDPYRKLVASDCALMVVDFQERLMPSIHEHERVARQAAKLVEGAKILDIPIVWTEQYKKGLGETVPEVAGAIGDKATPLEKITFSCIADEGILAAVKKLKRKTIVLCGIETHICVMQTAFGAMEEGWNVAAAEDATSSRRNTDHLAGIARMRGAGVVPTTVEMLLMEWMGRAGTDTFKKMLPLVKD